MRGELDEALGRLTSQFPDVPGDVIVSMLGDAYRLVVECAGEPLPDKAEELTRLRLEIRVQHPAYRPE